VDHFGYISSVAGNGTAGYAGDSGVATGAEINYPNSVTLDAAHHLFIVDSSNNRVRMMGTNNIIITVVGNGTNGFSGDGGMATNSTLSSPQSVAADGNGNLYIADYGNNRVREAGANGIISTVVGRAVNDGDSATNATINFAYGTAFDTIGNLYVADSFDNRIRKVDINGVITTVAGNGVRAYSGDGGAATNASLKQPMGVAVDFLGNIFIADSWNYRIRKVDTNGIITTIAGNGTAGYSGDGLLATNAKISNVWGLSVDQNGNLYITDSGNSRIRKVGPDGIISTLAGNGAPGFSGDGGAATNAELFLPSAAALDSVGNLYIADSQNNRIRKLDTNNYISTVAGNGSRNFSGDGGAATNAGLSTPYSVVVDSIGNLFITDTYNARVRKVSTNGIMSTVAGNGVPGFSGDGGPGNNASLSATYGASVDTSGNVFFSDLYNGRIRKVTYVDFADQPSFTLTNATLASVSNNYSVIITSASGSVTSSVVTVNLQLPPITPSYAVSNGSYNFTWSAVSNQIYQLQYTTNLAAPVWIDLGSPVTATSNIVYTTDLPGTDQQRFYRVRLVP
jgi:sugar lactone lactonase YvrE